MSENCLSCVFCKDINRNDESLIGTCKRYPPVLSPMSDEEAEKLEWNPDKSYAGRYESDIVPWVQPAVCAGDWCGEYRKRLGD